MRQLTFQLALGTWFAILGCHSLLQARVPRERRMMAGEFGGRGLGTATCVGAGMWFLSIGLLFGLKVFAAKRVPTGFILLGLVPGFLLALGCYVRDRISDGNRDA
jgi:hypothetical protein